jgi:hypothetical protein
MKNQALKYYKEPVPEGYFALLPDIILSKIKENETEFAVADTYFAAFEEKIMSKEQEEPVSLDYFDTFYDRLQTKMQFSEDLIEMPLLAAIPKELESVPAHYFESLAEKLPLQTPKSKIISLTFLQKWQKIAVGIAAMFILGIAGIAYHHLPTTSENSVSFQALSDEELLHAIASENLEDHVIEATFTQELAALKKEKATIKTISEEEIIEYLDAEDLDL